MSPSNAITPTWSLLPSSSTALRAADLAISILSPLIEPDLSMTSTMPRLGFSFSFSKSLRTGRISSSDRFVVAAEAERLLAAEHHEAAAEVLHVGAGNFHLPLRQRRGRHVRQDQQLVVLQVGEVVRHARRRADVDLDVFLLEGGDVSSRISFGSLSTISTRGLPAVKTRPLSLLLSSSVSFVEAAESRAVNLASRSLVDGLLKAEAVLPFLDRLASR